MSIPRLLLLETSAQPGLVAVAEGDRLLAVHLLDESRRHARDLAPAVGELLTAQGWGPRDISAVVVGRGPGSYTGLRVGIMSAKVFAYATGCAVVTLDTFAVIAAQSPEAPRLAVLADAQQDRVYVQEFADGKATTLLSIQPFAGWSAPHAPLMVTGPGLRKWAAHLPGHLRAVAADRWDPQPESMVRLGLARYVAGERDDVWTLEPLYLRPSAAEEQWAARGGKR